MFRDMTTKINSIATFVSLLLLPCALFLISCENNTPFDTQSPDDDPLILKPYNESGTGSFTYNLANPDTPLLDSVTVTPSDYTIVNWYLDGERVFTGFKIEMTFPAGVYALTIEAVTSAGKSTSRTGTVTVNPYDVDPYSAVPTGGRHVVPGVEMTLEGQHLDKVAELELTSDIYARTVVHSFAPNTKTAEQLTYTLPETADGRYFLRLKDAEGNLYGSGALEVHNGAVVLDGYQEFVPGSEWVLTGLNLQDVASVKLDETTITDLVVTTTSVTFTAPEAEEGEHTLSVANADGSAVLFVTSAGVVDHVSTLVSAETTLWTGPVALAWDAALVKVTAEEMAQVPLGATIFVYFEKLPDGDEHYYEGETYKQYYALRITTPWWDGWDLVAQMDMNEVPSPFSFTYDDRCKGNVETCGAMSLVGWGLNINKITFKP